jgi:hypothetical protein
MRNSLRAACAIWVGALLACPAAATAASVVVETRCDKMGCAESLAYSARPGERNDVTVVQEGDLVTIRDSAGIQPGAACEALDAFSARCALTVPTFNRSARFRLRDQADRLDARELAIGGSRLDGGAGRDRLQGPVAVGALFVGGPGNDAMTGGPLPDRFESKRRDGRDTMAGGGPPPLVDADYFPGYDEVFYARSTSVRVQLDGRPNDGGRRERDNVLNIEGVWGGRGDDVLIGSRADETLFGGAGRDLLRGRGGADRLDGGDRVSGRGAPVGSADRLEGGTGPDVLDGRGGPDLLIGGSGRDQLDGGRGPDRIRSPDVERDWILCGRGVDRLAASPADVVMRGCERRPAALSTSDGLVNWSGSVAQVSLIVGCPVAAPQDCEGTLVLAFPGRLHATSTYSAEPGRAAVVRLPLQATDLDDAARQLSGARASTARDTARFGELPAYPTDSVREVLGGPG